MEETKDYLLKRYVEYIEQLAQKKSSEIFTNGGIEYASHLMAVLFQNTEREARLFCHRFHPNLICREPYWSALKNYLSDKQKRLHVLVESDDTLQEEPMNLLRKEKNERLDNTVDYRLIKEEYRQKIFDGLDGSPCNFAVFDKNKFRFEYEPEEFKAFCSFNHESNCKVLIELFDEAFEHATRLD